MRKPLAKDALKQLAEQHGVCVRPLALRRTDTATGLTEVVEVPCGATLAAKCKPCAERGRRLRIQQIREGWHLADEPAVRSDRPGEDVLALVRVRAHLEFERQALHYQPMHPDERAAQIADVDDAIAELDEALAETSLRGHLTPKARDERPRRRRSTRRRQDTPDLPRLPVDPRTVGRAYSGRAGKTHRPSMLVTLTLGSHGPVHSHLRRGAYVAPCECGTRHGPNDDLLGTPVDNNLAAATGASTRDLMHRMGHASMRAALIYQHANSERDREIAASMDRRIAERARRAEPPREGEAPGRKTGRLARVTASAGTADATGTPMARKIEDA